MKEKMRFEEFKKVVVEEIKEWLPERFKTAHVSLQMVTKNNNLKLTGLTIRSLDSDVCPTIYLEKFYEEYESGTDMKEILKRIAQLQLNNDGTGKFDLDSLYDFEKIKGKIVPRIVNAEMNADLLEDRPHTIVADLAVTYHVLIDESEDGTASTVVTNEFMKSWKITVEELHRTSVMNLPLILPSTFNGMNEIMSEMMGMSEEEMNQMGMPTEEEQMYVLTNKQKVYGAASILDEKRMEEIVKMFGEFYILPSSVHEVLIVPKKEGMDVETLESIVKEVNSTQVEIEERLSDHVYIYTLENGLCIAD